MAPTQLRRSIVDEAAFPRVDEFFKLIECVADATLVSPAASVGKLVGTAVGALDGDCVGMCVGAKVTGTTGIHSTPEGRAPPSGICVVQ